MFMFVRLWPGGVYMATNKICKNHGHIKKIKGLVLQSQENITELRGGQAWPWAGGRRVDT